MPIGLHDEIIIWFLTFFGIISIISASNNMDYQKIHTKIHKFNKYEISFQFLFFFPQQMNNHLFIIMNKIPCIYMFNIV